MSVHYLHCDSPRSPFLQLFSQGHQKEGGTFQHIIHSPTKGEYSFLASISHITGLVTQLHTHNGWSGQVITLLLKLPPPTPKEYRVALLHTDTSIDQPFEGCPRKATSFPNLRMNFMHRHVEDIIIIMNEVTIPHPRFKQCDMFIPLEKLSEGITGKNVKYGGGEKAPPSCRQCHIGSRRDRVPGPVVRY